MWNEIDFRKEILIFDSCQTEFTTESIDSQKSKLARVHGHILRALESHFRMAHPRLSKLCQRALLQPKSCLLHNKTPNTLAVDEPFTLC
jgi:hypothetical protein